MAKKVKKKVVTKKKLKPQHPVFKTKLTLGQRAADIITNFCGSWTFIILVLVFIAAWMALNSIAFLYQWDPWPFIILNLCLSCLAALQAPVILMSQNRQTQRDRVKAEFDYRINKKAEKEIREIKNLLIRRRRKANSKDH